MHRTFYLDIETCPLPVERREFLRPTAATVKLGNIVDPGKAAAKINAAVSEFEAGTDAALDSLQAQIVLIGFAMGDNPVQQLSLAETGEGEMLSAFWQVITGGGFDSEVDIIGHNIRFDAGMLIHRSWLNGVTPPVGLVADLAQYQPKHWLDTMTRWQLGDRHADYRSLRVLCAAFGIQVKDSPVQAAKFYEWWAKDPVACLDYNRQDVEAVRELWGKIK